MSCSRCGATGVALSPPLCAACEHAACDAVLAKADRTAAHWCVEAGHMEARALGAEQRIAALEADLRDARLFCGVVLERLGGEVTVSFEKVERARACEIWCSPRGLERTLTYRLCACHPENREEA